MSIEEIKKTYEAIRNMSLDSSQAVEVDSLLFRKDAAEFSLASGYLYFFKTVNDREICAFFKGKGIFRLTSTDKIEKHQIRRFADKDTIVQEFEQAFFIFTDSTYEQITAQHTVKTSPMNNEIIKAAVNFRDLIRQRFIWNLDARVLSDLVTAEYGQFFLALLECPKEKHFLFTIEPLNEEEVSFIRYEPMKYSKRVDYETWYSMHAINPLISYQSQFDIQIINLDVSFDARQMLKAHAELEFTSLIDSPRAASVILSPYLRVESVVVGGDTCFFIQEDKKKDGELWIVFPAVLHKDSTYIMTMNYSGDEIMEDVGGDNYVVRERDSWYPSFYTKQRDPRRFIMKFAVPKDQTLLGTGKLLRNWREGDVAYSQWDSERDYTVAGFNYGKFSEVSQKGSKCAIDCYTNIKLSDDLAEVRRVLEQDVNIQAELEILPQELTTEGMGKNAAIESRNAYEVYTQFFGEIPMHHINISQQPQMFFGQSWPTLVFLPFTAFFNESLKERLGIVEGEKSVMWYESLASHEIAHQWWSHALTTDSYHDEWLEEGFATYSAALYLQATEGTDRFKEYMKILQEQVFAKVEKGKSATELGPIWLGERLRSLETPIGGRLVYSKGAYVLHMLRMMLFDYDKKSDERFIALMKDYVKTYSGKVVSTNDFKKIVEKHFGENMDWFFNQWVYDTEVPSYNIDYLVESLADKNYLLTVNVEESGVSPSFKMPFHLVVNFDKGHAVLNMMIEGLGTTTKQFRLPSKPKSIEPNPWYGVLCWVTK